mgnify:CR=1 FL=1
MKKLLVLSLILCLLCLTSCTVPSKDPNTNLEFWITENVADYDFSSYIYIPSFGGCSYVNSKYKVVYDENNIPTFPEYYVEYSVGAYPDYSSALNYITHITIQDPEIHVYGITINTSIEEAASILKNNGYKVELNDSNTYLSAEYGKCTITKGQYSIDIRVDVTNKFGISY